MEVLIQDCLRYLFDVYRTEGPRPVDLSRFVSLRGGNPMMIKAEMIRQGLIRIDIAKGFLAAISLRGLAQIDPSYLENLAKKILNAALEGEAAIISEVLGAHSPPGLAKDVAQYIRDNRLAIVQRFGNGDFRVFLRI